MKSRIFGLLLALPISDFCFGQAATVTEIIPPAEFVQLDYGDCSADAGIIVGAAWLPANRVAYRWSASGGFGWIGETNVESFATGVTPDGQVACGWWRATLGGRYDGFLWTAGEGISLLPHPEGRSWTPSCISGDGMVLAGAFAEGPPGAVRWTDADGFAPIPGMMQPLDMSYDGRVIVGYTPPVANLTSPCVWTPETGTVVLPRAGTESGRLNWVSQDGTIAYGFDSTLTRWTPATFPDDFGHFPGTNFTEVSASADGSFVVGGAGAVAGTWSEENGQRGPNDFERLYCIPMDDLYLLRFWGVSNDGRRLIGGGLGHIYIVDLPSPRPADFNGDGDIDLGDLATVLMNFGAETPTGDVDGDAVVTLADLAALLTAFESGCEDAP